MATPGQASHASRQTPATPHPANLSSRAKRVSVQSPEGISDSGNRRKLQKVSRACDFCKSKKLRCSGTIPCEICTKKQLECLYDAQYRRGRPPTPQASIVSPAPNSTTSSLETSVRRESRNHSTQLSSTIETPVQSRDSSNGAGGARHRSSPELDSAEIEGQFFDLTSNLTFLHRAWKRFSLQKGGTVPDVLTGSERSQPLMSAGDSPFSFVPDHPLFLPDRHIAESLFAFYFDQCVVTYRCLHRQYCASWLDVLLNNARSGSGLDTNLGHAKAALVINILAIASRRRENISGSSAGYNMDGFATSNSDQLFCEASRLTSEETGLPRLESVQARILQVLYLLQTGRMNQAWYAFGSTVPIVSALGLHRRSGRNRTGTGQNPAADYIIMQCRRRTFWVVYTIDKYLAVVYGRPRLYHDDDIDQDYPDRVNDEDMTSQGPSLSVPAMDCHIDSLISHTQVARIIDSISREVYSLKPMPRPERLAAAKKFGRKLHEWRDALPAHLGTIRPSSLIPPFRRQALALKLAYCHALMHANRPFLLGHDSQPDTALLHESVAECMSAARMALEVVDGIVGDSAVFYAFWWTPYVTFCALAVIYVWEIQQRAYGGNASDDPSLFELAERCQKHLAKAASADSPSRRYNIILEELRLEAKQESRQLSARQQGVQHDAYNTARVGESHVDMVPEANIANLDLENVLHEDGTHVLGIANPLNEWQATDWLDLDSSAFGPFPEFEGFPVLWDV